MEQEQSRVLNHTQNGANWGWCSQIWKTIHPISNSSDALGVSDIKTKPNCMEDWKVFRAWWDMYTLKCDTVSQKFNAWFYKLQQVPHFSVISTQ